MNFYVGMYGTLVLDEKGDRLPVLATERHLTGGITDYLTTTGLMYMFKPKDQVETSVLVHTLEYNQSLIFAI